MDKGRVVFVYSLEDSMKGLFFFPHHGQFISFNSEDSAIYL